MALALKKKATAEPTLTPARIRVYVAESSAINSELLVAALRRCRAVEIVGFACSTRDLLDAIEDARPHVVLLSAHLSDGPMSGFRALRQLRNAESRRRVILLVDNVTGEMVVDAFRAGAKGIFRRSESVQVLYRCIQAVHGGQVWANSAEIEHVLAALETAAPLRVIDSRGKNLLSAREQEVVYAVADGLTNREISERLKISEHTVKNHLFHIYEKLGISSRVELILYAVTEREASK